MENREIIKEAGKRNILTTGLLSTYPFISSTIFDKNGIFIELTPNLVGMAEYTEELKYGETVVVCIKRILPEKKKVKLIIV